MFGNGNNHKLKIFSGRANRPLTENIARTLGVPLGRITLGNFPDGETTVRIEEDVRGRDVFVVQPTCPPVNENLMELLIMLDAFKRASPARITAVLPYYGYARQDRKDKGRVPITAKLVANLITKAGANRVLALDLHAAQIQGFFDIPVDHLYAVKEITKYVHGLGIPPDELVVLSPDEGSIKKALDFQKTRRRQDRDRGQTPDERDRDQARAPDRRDARRQDRGHLRRHDLDRRHDRRRGERRASQRREARLRLRDARRPVRASDREAARAHIDQIAITDSIPLPPEKLLPNLKIISVAALVANAIHRIHGNESISALFNEEPPTTK